jgi:preprotein translocase subunit YajC
MLTSLGSGISAAFSILQSAGQPGSANFLLLMIVLMAAFYVVMILPAQRRQKKVAEMLKNLKAGDKVITNGGIYGTIVGLEDEAVQLRIAEQVKVKVSRSAIAGLQAEPQPKESSKTA